MKPKALVCALVATSLATAGPAFAQADNQENLDRNFQQIQRAQEWQARHGYQPPPGMRVYPAPGQPAYRQPGQPGYQQPGQRGYQQPGQPGYQQPGRPGYQQPGRPGYDARRDGRNYNEYGAGPDHNFHPGDRLPPQYRHHNYVVNDWRGHHLSAPPPGYQWVQTGADYVLVAIATGLIVQLLLNN